ncbi:MAG: alanine racemase [Marinilabiliales bacterium]
MYIKPTFIIDEKKCRNNIRKMADKAKKSGLIFRPHFKTHQSEIVSHWFAQEGIDKITVSSVDMAEFFINLGWKNITIAFPFNILELHRINSLPETITINLLVESVEVTKYIANKSKRNFNIFIKINAGYNRTGLEPNNNSEIESIIDTCNSSSKICFKGFLSHFGNTYKADNPEEVINIYNESVSKIKKLKQLYPKALISIGDTPSCSIINDFNYIDEIRPGNFVFYDIMQLNIGSCKFENIAVAVACPVVSIHKSRNEIVIYGGAVHLSKEYIIINDSPVYGYISLFQNNGWKQLLPDTYLKSLSQEHGIIKTNSTIISKFKVGDLIYVIPVHSCLTANLLKEQVII